MTFLSLSHRHPHHLWCETHTGLIYYLPEAAAHRLIASIGAMSAPGSMLYFDFMHSAALNGTGMMEARGMGILEARRMHLCRISDSPSDMAT